MNKKNILSLLFLIPLSATNLHAMKKSKSDDCLSQEKVMTSFWQKVSKISQKEKDDIARKILLSRGARIPTRNRDIKAIAAAIYVGVNPNLRWDFRTILSKALEYHDYKLVKLLLVYGADPREKYYSKLPIFLAKTKTMTQLLIKYGGYIRHDCFQANADSILSNCLLFNVQDKESTVDLAKFYLKENNTLNYNQYRLNFALYKLIRSYNSIKNFYAKAQLLIASGANTILHNRNNPNFMYDQIRRHSAYDDLFYNKHVRQMCNFIYNRVKACKTALITVKSGNLKKLEKIIQYFPEMVNATDQNGNCLLHHAVNLKNKKLAYEITKFLIGKGAWLNRRNKKGISPFALACNKKRKKIILMMLPFVNPENIDFQMQVHDIARMIWFVQLLHQNIVKQHKNNK